MSPQPEQEWLSEFHVKHWCFRKPVLSVLEGGGGAAAEGAL